MFLKLKLQTVFVYNDLFEFIEKGQLQIWWPSATRSVRYGGQCVVLGQWDGRVIPT